MDLDEPAAAKLGGTPVPYRQRVVYWDRQSRPGNTDAYELEIALVEFPQATQFLEHVFDQASRGSTSRVIASSRSHIRVSEDGGDTWRAIEAPVGAPFTRCFSTRSGRHLLQQLGDGGVHLFDADWRYLGRRDAGPYGWHGTWSIDQSATGTIMFAEYADEGEIFRVRCSEDDGESWHVAFEVSGSANAQAGSVRHFHTCQADPFDEGVWWLSSGDSQTQNKLWCSRDDGKTWLELEGVYRPNGTDGVSPRHVENVKRHTAEIFTPDWIYWATDDNLGSCARLVRMPRSRAVGGLELLSRFTRNEMRNLVALEPGVFLAISEAKHESKQAQLFCVAADGTVLARFDLPNTGTVRSGFCRSRSSRAAVTGTFFSFSDGHIVAPNAQFLKWRVRRYERSATEQARLAFAERQEGLRQEEHGHGDAVAHLDACAAERQRSRSDCGDADLLERRRLTLCPA